MLKLSTRILFLMVMVCGCAFKTQVIDDRIFDSPISPKIKFEVSPEFSYLGHVAPNYFGEGTGGASSNFTTVKDDIYVFSELGKNLNIDRVIIVKVSRIQEDWRFLADPFDGWEDLLDRGFEYLGDFQYDYCVTLIGLGERLSKFIDSKSYVPGRGYLAKVYSRYCGEGNHCLLKVTYAEDLDLVLKRHGNSNLEDYLETLGKNCESSFNVID